MTILHAMSMGMRGQQNVSQKMKCCRILSLEKQLFVLIVNWGMAAQTKIVTPKYKGKIFDK